jgi:hypothetical protein
MHAAPPGQRRLVDIRPASPPLPTAASMPPPPPLPDDLLRLVGRRAAQDAMQAFVKSRRRALLPAAAELCRALLALRAASPLLLAGDADTWNTALLHVHARGDELARDTYAAVSAVATGRLPARRALALVCLTGCELCGRRGVRKATWTFGVRCCQACLEENTISDYRLRACGLTDEAVLEALPHTRVGLYAPRVGSYHLRFYWRDAALEAVRAGVPDAASLQDAAVKVAERAAAEARTRAEAAAAHAEAQRRTVLLALATTTTTTTTTTASCEVLRRRSPAFALACAGGADLTAADAAKVVEEVRAIALRTSVARWLRDLAGGRRTVHGQGTRRIDDAVRRVLAHQAHQARQAPTKAWFVREVWPEMSGAIMAEEAEAARQAVEEAAMWAASREAAERARVAWEEEAAERGRVARGEKAAARAERRAEQERARVAWEAFKARAAQEARDADPALTGFDPADRQSAVYPCTLCAEGSTRRFDYNGLACHQRGKHGRR